MKNGRNLLRNIQKLKSKVVESKVKEARKQKGEQT